MKILQVVPFFSPIFGGSAISTYYVSRELAKRGHEVTILTSDCQLSREWIESLLQVRVFPFKTQLRWANFYVTPGIIRHAKERIKSFDLIHVHNYRSFQNIIVHHYARKYAVPYVLQARGSLPRSIGDKQKLKLIYDMSFGHRILRDASKAIVLNQTEAEQHRRMGVPEGKIAIIPNGINLSEYSNLPPEGRFREKFRIKENKKIILYMGRLHKIKGIDFLLKAHAKLIKEMRAENAFLVIAGSDDGYLSEVKFLSSRLGLEDKVLLTGPLYGRDKLEAYVDAEAIAVPSRYETFPNAVLEAYACSKPVIASRLESLCDIVIHGKTGFLFERSNIDELAHYLKIILSNSANAEKMGIDARKFVSTNLSLSKVIDMLERLYGTLNN